MNHDDAKKCVKLLAGLFPNQLTQDQARHAAGRFREFEAADVERAVREHRDAHEFIGWPQLFEGCRAVAKGREQTTENASNEGTWADVFRRQRPDMADASDYEVVLRIHRGWWFKCSRSDGARRKLDQSCTVLLVRFGMSQADAEKWSATVFEDSPDFFRQCLDEIRAAAAQTGQAA